MSCLTSSARWVVEPGETHLIYSKRSTVNRKIRWHPLCNWIICRNIPASQRTCSDAGRGYFRWLHRQGEFRFFLKHVFTKKISEWWRFFTSLLTYPVRPSSHCLPAYSTLSRILNSKLIRTVVVVSWPTPGNTVGTENIHTQQSAATEQIIPASLDLIWAPCRSSMDTSHKQFLSTFSYYSFKHETTDPIEIKDPGLEEQRTLHLV